MAGLTREVRRLGGVEPTTANPDSFCLPLEAEQAEELPDPIQPDPGRPGHPFDELQNYLLENVATVLVDEADLPRKKACRILAAILLHCFGKAPHASGTSLEDAVEPLSESLERQWRKLRQQVLMETENERVLPKSEVPGDQNSPLGDQRA
jgi:hypothetical protein